MSDRFEQSLNILKRHGLHAVPLEVGGKKLLRKGKMNEQGFRGDESGAVNFGVVLGETSGGLVDVDLDMAEARQLVDHVFGVGSVAFGRGGHTTHLLFRHTGDAPKQIVFGFTNKESAAKLLGLESGTDDKCGVVELRASAGQYVMVPRSLHPSGDTIEWLPGRSPDDIDLNDRAPWPQIFESGRLLAFLAVVLRRWPRQEGSGRHELTLALTGALARMIKDDDKVDELVRSIRDEAGDTKRTEAAHAATTRAKLEAGDEATGLPTLCRGLGIEELLPDIQSWFADKAKDGKQTQDRPTMLELAADVLAKRPARLLRYNGEWLTRAGGAYRGREDESIRTEIYGVFPSANQKLVSNIADALKARTQIDRNDYSPPCWLDGRQSPAPSNLLVLRNGLLDLTTGELTAPTDEFFTRNALDFDYDPAAPPPERWLRFLEEVWPEEIDCRETLQMLFGYHLTPDTSQQIISVLCGPTRCGKGTIGRAQIKLLGAQNVAMPSLSSLGEPFGRQPLIGKQLALVADMRIGARTDKAAVTEALLAISGEDAVSVPRKNTTDWEGRLRARFMIMSNEPPTLNDPSGALRGRYVVLQMRQSFLGREDRALDSKIEAELPGVLNWAIEGWRKLRAAGRFTQPDSASDLTESIHRLQSPLSAFIEDECEVAPEARADKEVLYDRFKLWCSRSDRAWHGGKDVFSKELLTAGGGKVRAGKAQQKGERRPVYQGIRLRRDSEDVPF